MKKKPTKPKKPSKLSKTVIRENVEDLVIDLFLDAEHGIAPTPTVADLQTVFQGIGSNDAYWLRVAKKYEPEALKAMSIKLPKAQAKKPAKKR